MTYAQFLYVIIACFVAGSVFKKLTRLVKGLQQSWHDRDTAGTCELSVHGYSYAHVCCARAQTDATPQAYMPEFIPRCMHGFTITRMSAPSMSTPRIGALAL